MSNPDALITSAELAAAIGVSRTQIDRDRAAGALQEGRKLGRDWVYPASVVATYRAWRAEHVRAPGRPRKDGAAERDEKEKAT